MFGMLSQWSVAAVDIIGLVIPGLHEKNGSGVYDKIITRTVIDNGQGKLRVLPPARALSEFETCTNCCMSPANKNPDFYSYGSDVVQSDPMNTAKVYIFTAFGSAPINSLNALKGKTVGIRDGMPYGNKFDKAGLKLSSVSDIEKNVKKLDGGRIGAFVAYVPDAYLAFKGMGKPEYTHDKENPIAVHPDSMVCRGVDASFLSGFNAKLDSMKASGELNKLLGDSQVN